MLLEASGVAAAAAAAIAAAGVDAKQTLQLAAPSPAGEVGSEQTAQLAASGNPFALARRAASTDSETSNS